MPGNCNNFWDKTPRNSYSNCLKINIFIGLNFIKPIIFI